MKTSQIIYCLFLSILLYILASIMGQEFNPLKWTNVEGKFWFSFFQMMIWIVPGFINYLDPDPKNKSY